MKRIIILLLRLTDWLLRVYTKEPDIYYKGYFTENLISRLKADKVR